MPNVGQSNGHVPVTISGNNFMRTDSGAYCRFGDQIVVAKVISSTTIFCEAPPLREIEEIQTFAVSNVTTTWYLYAERCIKGVCSDGILTL